jgi:starch-binding outer membrane protein SusE/F
MRAIKKLLLLIMGVTLLALSCTKIEELPSYGNGQAVTLGPSKFAVVPTPADSLSTVLSFFWTSPNYATDTANIKYILELDSTGRNFSKKITREVIGKKTINFTGRELNTILLNYGFALGTPYNMDVRVISSYKNNNERLTSNVIKVAITPYTDPAVLTATATNLTLDLANAAVNAITYNWTQSFAGYAGNINYILQFDSAGKNFVAPQEIPIGNKIYTKTFTQGEINETGLTSGIPGGNSGKVEYRIKAITAQGAIAYSNVYNVTMKTYVPILRFYMPGGYQAATGNGNDWDPGTAPELIRDLRSSVLNKMYYIYLYLPAGAEFKFTQGRAWDVNYGGSGGVLSTGGANLTVPTAGYYRVSINRVTLQYNITEGRMGFVGGSTGAGWNPPNVFPTYAMGTAGTNLFVGINTFPTTGGWKLIDNNAWNNGSNAVDETRSYGTPNGDGGTMEVNGANFADITTAPVRSRVIWDGRDVNNIKYFMSPAAEMRVVGDGINQAGVNDWDPASSPQMIYGGNGVWTITITLKANKDIKFLAGGAWGAFDYEDNGAGAGIDRKIRWEGGSNFKTPAAAGTYTITLNENLQTMKIN